jgi:site-specific DNA recombinase
MTRRGWKLRAPSADRWQGEIGNKGMARSKTAAIYARFSSDMQQDRSIDDQIAICQNLASREGLKIVATYSDRAKSGASLFDRDALLELMTDAKARRFAVVIVESLDRISRDQEDLAGVFKRLNFHDVELRTVNEGVTTPIHVSVRGLVGSLFLADLGNKVRRGQGGRAREGKIPGSVPLGYRIIAGKKGEPEIDPEQAKVVVRIYREYVAGNSPREIALGLMRDGVPASREAGRWNYQHLIGGGAGRFGILSNPIYIGQLIWNKTRRIVNPDSGVKLKRPSPENEIRADVPHLRIMDDELWNAAQNLRASRARAAFGPTGKRPFISHSKKHLLANILRCGACGSHMRINSVTRGVPYAACTAAKLYGTCEHHRTYNMQRLQAGVLAGFRSRLTDPRALMEAARAYHAEWTERNKKNRGEHAAVLAKLKRVMVRIDRLVDAIENSDLPVKDLVAKLQPLEVERVGLAERLRLIEAEGTSVVDLHPNVIADYQANIERLHAALEQDALALENRTAFRTLIDSIVVHPTGDRTDYEFTPYGRLGALMGGVELFPTARTPQKILKEQGLEVCDDVASPNTSTTASHKIVCLGRWKEAA